MEEREKEGRSKRIKGKRCAANSVTSRRGIGDEARPPKISIGGLLGVILMSCKKRSALFLRSEEAVAFHPMIMMPVKLSRRIFG